MPKFSSGSGYFFPAWLFVFSSTALAQPRYATRLQQLLLLFKHCLSLRFQLQKLASAFSYWFYLCCFAMLRFALLLTEKLQLNSCVWFSCWVAAAATVEIAMFFTTRLIVVFCECKTAYRFSVSCILIGRSWLIDAKCRTDTPTCFVD